MGWVGSQSPKGSNRQPSPSDKSSGVVKKRKKDMLARCQSQDPLWKILDKHIGGREGLLAAALASENPKAKALAELILDQAHAKFGTKALVQKANITATEVREMFRERKVLEATLELYGELPEIIKDATTDAKASFVPCVECKGTGKDETGAPHFVCEGRGKVRRPGDKDKLSFVGQAAGMVGQKGPFVQTNVQINNQQPVQTSSFDEMMRKATIVVGPKKQIEGVVEAEVVEKK